MPSTHFKLMDKVTNVAEHVFTVQTQNEDLEFKERHSYI